MLHFRISGVWKNHNNEVTHYALHELTNTGIDRAVRITKDEAIRLLEKGHTIETWLWNYGLSDWEVGQEVRVVDTPEGKYLQSDPYNPLTHDLAHLIDYDWIILKFNFH
ncbi:hypothetical protein PV783_24730 [Chitinophaga sp. CC14]|uniref:hypothetical protein n=1 Tax=Chitinophaga sp. CC14 TaxID=3029199 RepID=UPI003B80C32D